MAVQSYQRGLFFIVGVIVGTVVTHIGTSFTGSPVLVASSSREPIGSSMGSLQEVRDTRALAASNVNLSFMGHGEMKRGHITEATQEFRDEKYHKGLFKYFNMISCNIVAFQTQYIASTKVEMRRI